MSMSKSPRPDSPNSSNITSNSDTPHQQGMATSNADLAGPDSVNDGLTGNGVRADDLRINELTDTPSGSASTPLAHQSEHNRKIAETGDYDGLTFDVIEEEVADGHQVVSRGVYLAPNLITTLSLLSGFFSILSSMQGDFYKASLAIFLSGLLDGADGRVARMLNAQSPFGEQYDSLADMLAFGVAPAILIYSFALQPLGRVGIACAFVFTACAAFRLARFNVQIGEVDKKFFVGLASPLAAILVTSAVMVAIDHSQWIGEYDTQIMFACAAWVVICGLLMVSNIKYYSFKEFDKKKVPFVALIIAVLVMAIVLYDIPVGLLAIGIIYALSGIISTIKAKMKN